MWLFSFFWGGLFGAGRVVMLSPDSDSEYGFRYGVPGFRIEQAGAGGWHQGKSADRFRRVRVRLDDPPPASVGVTLEMLFGTDTGLVLPSLLRRRSESEPKEVREMGGRFKAQSMIVAEVQHAREQVCASSAA